MTGPEKPRLRANERRYFTAKVAPSDSRKGKSEAVDSAPVAAAAAAAGASSIGDGLGDDETACREVLQLLPPPSLLQDVPNKKQRQEKVAAALKRTHSILKVIPC